MSYAFMRMNLKKRRGKKVSSITIILIKYWEKKKKLNITKSIVFNALFYNNI